MTELDKLTQRAPQLESPATLDDQVLRAAGKKLQRQSVRPSREYEPQKTRWPVVAYALSSLCALGIGIGLWQQFNNASNSQLIDSAPVQAEIASVDNRLEESKPDIPWVAKDKLQSQVAENRSISADTLRSAVTMSNSTSELHSDISASVESFSRSTNSGAQSATAAIAADIQHNNLELESVADSQPSASIQLKRRESVNTNKAAAQASATVVSGITHRSTGWLRSQPDSTYTVRVEFDGALNELEVVWNALPVRADLVIPDSATANRLLLYGTFNEEAEAEEALFRLYKVMQSNLATHARIELTIVQYADLPFYIE